jgi:hypothetical protein
MKSQMKILYVGPDYVGSNGTSWRDAFVQLGFEVRTFDDESFVRPGATLRAKAWRKLYGRPAADCIAALNGALASAIDGFKPDLTFYVKARYVLPETIRRGAVSGPSLAYMNDDMFSPANQTFTFFDNIRQFDCILTTKSYNVREFHAAGAARAVYIPNAYDPAIHFPAKPQAGELAPLHGDVGFLGTFRPERADFLARAAGGEFHLNVWGNGWEKMNRADNWHRRWRWRRLARAIRGGELRGVEMAKAIQANKIALGLLYHKNRDLHTSRSFEIPACGGFLLAERTEEHRMYFQEDAEAVYFESIEEMRNKIRFYLAHENLRERIAEAGYRRCLNSRATYADRARFAIELIRGGRAPAREELCRSSS